MEHDITDRIPFRVESPRGDDIIGTNTNTGAIISDHEAKTRGEPFQPGIPRDKIQEAIEAALKQEKWVCVEKTDGSTELLTKKDIPIASDEKSVEAAAAVKAEQPKEPVKPAVEQPKEGEKPSGNDWKDAFSVTPKPAPKPATTNPTPAPKPDKPKEVWVSKFESIKSATATHKGKGG